MDFWEHRAVQGAAREQENRGAVEQEKEAGRVRDDEDPPEEMDRTRLSPRQMAALKAFHAGASLKDTAKAAGVSRQTLHRWRTIYHSFSRAMEVWEEGQMIIARSRLVDMADNAIDALAQTIEDGNARAAMMVLRSLQILRTYAPLKPPAEGAGREHAAREQLSSRTVEQLKEADAGAGKPVASDGKVAERLHVPGKIDPAAQQIRAIANPPVQTPKTAIMAGKAGSAIKMACDSALQDVTKGYEMLQASHGEPGSV